MAADRLPLVDADAALEALPLAVAVVDARRLARPLLYVNEAYVQLTGFLAQDVIGQGAIVLISAENDPLVQQQVRSALDDDRPYSAEILTRKCDGTLLWTRIALRPIRGANHALDRILVTLEDIADHKRARDSVRASEARLDVAMAASELSMWDWNVTRNEVYYNDQWRVSLGIEPRELLQREGLTERLMLPDDMPAVLDQFEQHYRGETPYFECEYPLPMANGARKWFFAHARVVRRDAEGRAERVVGVLRDISRRLQHIAESRSAEERWARAVRGTSDGLYDWDLLTGVVWYAERFREIVGAGGASFSDTFQAFQAVLHADDRTPVLVAIRAHLENQSLLDVRCRVVRPDGAFIWCRLRGQAERDASGRPLRVAGSLSDITAQIAAENALSRSQDFYGTIIDSLPLYIAYADRQQRIVYANRQFQEFFRVPLSDSRGRTISELIGERRYGAIGSLVARALGGELVDGQGRFRDADGNPVELDATFVPHRDESGEVIGCFVAARDMTERRLLEAELRQSQKMEAVGRLTGGIAHDFNNLLSVMMGNMQLLARSLRESPRLLRQTETALKAAMRGADLTRRLLAFARQQVLEPRVVDLNALVSGMYELLRRTLTGEIDLRLALDSSAWPARVDAGQVENAILNLVINARDAMPEGGVITVTTSNATIAAERGSREEGLSPGEYVLLEVSDTGTGMSAETLKRVFEPFFTTKDVGKGSGLGLPMVYGFMKQSGGHVTVTSSQGKGTVAHLYFPRTRDEVESVSLPDPAPAELPRGHETILIVEDNAEVRATTLDMLTGLGYRALEAANGYQALEQFMQHPDIALVFSDVMLPGGLLGTSLVHKLRERRPGLKVLMTSGFSESSIMHRGLVDGTIDVLAKPYKIEELARRVRAKLDGKEENQRVPA